jgi:hypothetical protein
MPLRVYRPGDNDAMFDRVQFERFSLALGKRILPVFSDRQTGAYAVLAPIEVIRALGMAFFFAAHKHDVLLDAAI